MSKTEPEPETAAPRLPGPPIPSHADLFLAFFKITLSGFGGTLPWTRRMFVEEKRWLTAEEFNDVYALCQFLPGPNIVNLTAVFGSRMRGATGAMAAWAGFLIVPFCVMLAAAMLYERYGDVEAVRRVLSGIAPAAAGLIVATVAKMAAPMFRSFGPAPIVLLVTAFAIGLMRWPLLLVLIVIAPVSIALAWARLSQVRR
ncbi:MAG: chromate transporter [Xanthobacteraceae bacterium]|nr:chromate transporter [Xanthobacteraceae bacterium]